MVAVHPGFGKPSLFSGAVQARGKKRPAPIQNSDGDEEEDSGEDDVVTQGDLWGSEDSDEDMVDDYGAASNSEDEEEKVSLFWVFSSRSFCLFEVLSYCVALAVLEISSSCLCLLMPGLRVCVTTPSLFDLCWPELYLAQAGL